MEDSPNPSPAVRLDQPVEPYLAGHYAHHLDAKGRLVLPAMFRPSFTGLAYVTPWEQGQCLAMWTALGYRQAVSWVRVKGVSSYRAASGDAPRPADLMRSLLSHATMVRPDAQGRFVLPPGPRQDAGLAKDVAVIGHGDHVELWAPERYDERDRGAGPMIDMVFEDYEHEEH